jgi:hypothetical protein
MLLSRCSRLIIPRAPLPGSAPALHPLSLLAPRPRLPPTTRPSSLLDPRPLALLAHPRAGARGAARGCICSASGTAPLVKVPSPIISLPCV